jgi:hypothetical protein
MFSPGGFKNIRKCRFPASMPANRVVAHFLRNDPMMSSRMA